MLNYIKKLVSNRIILHTLFWLLSFYILLNHFSISSQITLVDYIFTALFHVSIITTVYLNLYVLMPRFLDKSHYPLYVFSLFVLYFIFYGLHIFTFDFLSEIIFPGYYLITFYSPLELLKYFIIYIGITTLFVLSKSWFELLDSRKKLAEAEKENLQNELKALKAQVNPHFLFNSLNTIYSLALKRSESTPEIILKLSNVLRYMIYESNEKVVALKKEMEFIQNFIDLQKLRTHNPGIIDFRLEGEIRDQKIAPLIFIVFIENAFKHGLKGDISDQIIKIRFIIDEDQIKFQTENNIGHSVEPDDDRFKGMGLENVKRRLELMYRGKYILKISEKPELFFVDLVVKI